MIRALMRVDPMWPTYRPWAVLPLLGILFGAVSGVVSTSAPDADLFDRWSLDVIYIAMMLMMCCTSARGLGFLTSNPRWLDPLPVSATDVRRARRAGRVLGLAAWWLLVALVSWAAAPTWHLVELTTHVSVALLAAAEIFTAIRVLDPDLRPARERALRIAALAAAVTVVVARSLPITAFVALFAYACLLLVERRSSPPARDEQNSARLAGLMGDPRIGGFYAFNLLMALVVGREFARSDRHDAFNVMLLSMPASTFLYYWRMSGAARAALPISRTQPFVLGVLFPLVIAR